MDVLVQQEGVCATDMGATPIAAMNLKPYDQLSNNHQWRSVWCLPSCLSGPRGPWQGGPSQERTIIRCRVQLKSNIYEWNVCGRNRLCLIICLSLLHPEPRGLWSSGLNCPSFHCQARRVCYIIMMKMRIHSSSTTAGERRPWHCSLHGKEGWVAWLGSHFGTSQAFDLRHHHWQHTRTSPCYPFLQEDPRTSG